MSRLFALIFLGCATAGCSTTSSIETTASLGKQETSYSFAGSQMELGGNAFPPPAFNQFCATQPNICTTVGGAETVKLTPDRMAELKAVNDQVNGRIREQDDRLSTGRSDDWRLPKDVGDCEDFAILKKYELIKRGWSPSVLLLTVVRAGGEGHVVLTVRTDKGDLLLDNRTNTIRQWSRAPYRFFARQSQTRYGKWDQII